jgi:hypothetical protein
MLEGSVQRIEKRYPLREQRLVFGKRKLKTLNHLTNRDRLGSAKTGVFQVQVVNDRGNPLDGWFLDLENTAERFERAAFPLMAELHAEHVERQSILRNGVPILGKPKACLRIDEPPNEPG